MPRRPKSNDDDISLFPFLSIIASVIGVLTMMIATLALAQTDKPDVAQIEAYEDSQKELKASEERIAELKQEISVAQSDSLEIQEQRQQLTVTVAELKKLFEELQQVEQELAAQKEVVIVIPTLDKQMRESLDDMQNQAEELKEQIAQLESNLDERTNPKEANVTILPQGSGQNFQPHFIECADGALVLHTSENPKRIPAGAMTKDADFLAVLNEVANGKDDTLVLLIRSDGLNTYRAVKRLCDQREIRNGKLPIVGKGRVDLSAFTGTQP
ncbi:hypothetical protein [Neorhodopirellula lusitana]|uniref:hypothetical protein n=1 Tax=Neorhodopirellula lusitana TaxID=445327 RepID=UPI00384DB92B